MSNKFYPITELEEVINAKGILNAPNATIRLLGLDSRKLTDVKHTLFFAIKSRRDGHQFLQEVYDQGIRNFVISDDSTALIKYQDTNIFLVKDTLQALQSLTAWHRKQFE